jgi:alkylation response protein AidB-like acyl-CoA dehydrogenase
VPIRKSDYETVRVAGVDFVETAQLLADEVLFPAALETDAAEVVPVELLDALADAGFYGLEGADFETVCLVVEALASGCLTTTFVWVQHVGAARAATLSENPAMAEWAPLLVSGRRRAGLALGGALPGKPLIVARQADGGWRLDGVSPFVSGWGRIDVVHTAGRTEDGRIVWGLVDADDLAVERLRLVALDATATVRADFRGVELPGERITSVHPYQEGPTPPEVLRIHASLALGVAGRCCRLLGTSALDDELRRCRAELDRLDPETIEATRGQAGELALRAAAALVATRGSRSLLLDDHAQRLAREALFALAYALRPGSRVAVLDRLER